LIPSPAGRPAGLFDGVSQTQENAMARTTKTFRKTTKAMGKNRKSQKIENYPDTEGMELPEPIDGLNEAKQVARDQTFIERQMAKQYQGVPIPATKVYRREMPEFKNCHAECWMLVNEQAGTYTFANTYNSQLKASYHAGHYTYQLTDKSQKKVAKKSEDMIEVEVTEWPAWITNAHALKRKARA
jgi:hypothetical protein